MPKVVLTNVFASVGGNDFSDHVASATIEYSADPVEDTAMGNNTHTFRGGLKSWSMTLQLQQDYAAGDIDALVFPLIGTTVTVIGRPDAGAVSTTNPNFTGTALIQGYQPIQGGVGELATFQLTTSPAGDLSRATA